MDDIEFERFVTATAGRLHNLALALTCSHASAQDLTQATLEKVFKAWRKVTPTDPAAYATTALIRTFYSERRLHRNRREHSADPHSLALDHPTRDHYKGVDQRLRLQTALATLAPRQRDAVVLRFFEDLPVADVAALMDCSEGNVKRLCHDGLSTLRRTLDHDELARIP